MKWREFEGIIIKITQSKLIVSFLFLGEMDGCYLALFLRKANADCLLVVSAKSNEPSIGWPSQGLSIRHKYSLQLFLAFRPCNIAMVPAEISLCKYLRVPMENLLLVPLDAIRIMFHLRICFPRIFASCHGYYFQVCSFHNILIGPIRFLKPIQSKCYLQLMETQ